MRQAFLWACALAIAASLLVATDYRSRDPDSALYAQLSGELAEQPPSRWIAPEWRGAWKEFYCEPIRVEAFGDRVFAHAVQRGRGKESGAEIEAITVVRVRTIWRAASGVTPRRPMRAR